MAVEENESERKQAEDKSIFFRFGDDLAVDDNSHRVVPRRKMAGATSIFMIIEGSRKEVANRFVDHARSHPRRSLPAAVKQVGRFNANAQTIPSALRRRIRILVHKQSGDGAGASAVDGDGRRVSGAGGESDVGSASAGNSCIDRVDVFGVGAGKQGRKSQQLVVGAVGVVQVASKGERVSEVKISAASDAGGAGVASSAAAGEDPDGLVGGVVLAGIDVDVKLRLALFKGNKRKQSRHQKKGPPPPPQIACRLLRGSYSS